MPRRIKATSLKDFAEPITGEALNQPVAMLRAPRRSSEAFELHDDSAIGLDEARELRNWLARTPASRLPIMKRL